MRSKKLQRQLSKSLGYEEVEEEIPALLEKIKSNNVSEISEKLALLTENFPAFLEAVDSSYEQMEKNLTHAQRSLELSTKEVEEGNKNLRVEVRKVTNLLNNMQQAVFTIDKDGTIVAPVSKYSAQVFGAEVVGQNVFDYLFKEIGKETEKYAAIKSAITAVFGDGELQWSLMEDEFPRRVVLSLDGNEKILRVMTTPLWDEQELVERLMFIVEDVTELEALNRKIELEKQRTGQQMTIVQELISNNRKTIFEQLEKFWTYYNEAVTILEKQNLSPDELNQVFRNLHTVKGNGRTFNFNLLSSVTHKVESEFVKIRDTAVSPDQQKEQLPQFSQETIPQLKEVLDAYQAMVDKLFSDSASSEEAQPGAKVDSCISAEAEWILSQLSQSSTMSAEVKNRMGKLLTYLAGESKLKKIETTLNQAATAVASSTGKKVKVICKIEDQITIPENFEARMTDSLIHMVRNSVDHGIESVEDRSQKGKNPMGTITVTIAKNSKGGVQVSVRDDGQGLREDLILRKAIANKIVSESEAKKLSKEGIWGLIVRAGFSTREEASEFSGRGVGLDVVSETVKSVKGTLKISSETDKGTEIVMDIPKAS